jgi:hypothetical protein
MADRLYMVEKNEKIDMIKAFCEIEKETVIHQSDQKCKDEVP